MSSFFSSSNFIMYNKQSSERDSVESKLMNPHRIWIWARWFPIWWLTFKFTEERNEHTEMAASRLTYSQWMDTLWYLRGKCPGQEGFWAVLSVHFAFIRPLGEMKSAKPGQESSNPERKNYASECVYQSINRLKPHFRPESKCFTKAIVPTS